MYNNIILIIIHERIGYITTETFCKRTLIQVVFCSSIMTYVFFV